PSRPAVKVPRKQAGYMTVNLNRYVRQIILAYSGASIHDNTREGRSSLGTTQLAIFRRSR
ncbi:MAG: hypothetical protein V3U07_06375, partial [Nitrospirales bacterium]